MFWPFVQSVNFSLVPYKHRTKVMGCASFLWSMFLCYEKETSRVFRYINAHFTSVLEMFLALK